MSEGLSRASRKLEHHAAAQDANEWEAARRRWQSLSFGRQLQLAQVLAAARRQEYVQRYREVLQLGAGLKRRRDAQGQEYLHREVCLIFIVRRKLATSARGMSAAQQLPREMPAPAWVAGRDQLVVVPCDVQPQERVLGGRAQVAGAVASDDGTGHRDNGSLACAVRAGSRTYAISAIHVFSPQPLDGGPLRAAVALRRYAASGTAIEPQVMARSAALGGRLARWPVRSFDVQLAEVVDGVRLKAALAGFVLSRQRPWVRNIVELGDRVADGRLLELLVPANHPVRGTNGVVSLSAALDMTDEDHVLDYHFADGDGQVLHQALKLQLRFGEATLPGDSGSPVIVRNDGGEAPSFVGMHIAGNAAQGLSFVIPAWRLFAADSYLAVNGGLPAGALRLVTQV